MAKSTDDPLVRVIVKMPASLLRKVDVEWHRRQLPNRSETIRQILEEATDPEKAKKRGDKR